MQQPSGPLPSASASTSAAPRSRRSRSTPRAASSRARRVATPRDDYAPTSTRSRASSPTLEARARRARARVGIGTPGAISPRDRPGQERQLDRGSTGSRSRATSAHALGARGAGRQRRQLLRALRGDRRRRRAAQRVVFGVILGTGVGGGIVVDGRVCGRRRTRSPASGATTRCRARDEAALPGTAVLLRPARLHRDLPVRARAGAPITRRVAGVPRRAARSTRGDRRARRAGDARRSADARRATPIAWRARSRP